MPHNRNRLICKIDFTPLIDICLVLMIVFMVCAPLKPHIFKDKILQNQTEDWMWCVPYDEMTYILIVVNNRNKIMINGLIIEEEQFEIELAELYRSDPDKRKNNVIFLAPTTWKYGKVIKYIDSIKHAGLDNISLQIQFNDKVDLY